MPATPAPQLNEVCSAWESGRGRPWRRGPCTHVGTCSWVLPPFGDGASVRECGGNKADLPTRGGVRLTLTGLCCNTRLGGGQARALQGEPTPRPGERCWAASLRRPAQLRAGSHQRSAMGAGGCGALAGATPCARPPGRDHGRRAVQERRAFGDPSPFVRGAAGRSCLPRCPAGPAAGAGRPRPPTCFRTAAPTPVQNRLCAGPPAPHERRFNGLRVGGREARASLPVPPWDLAPPSAWKVRVAEKKEKQPASRRPCPSESTPVHPCVAGAIACEVVPVAQRLQEPGERRRYLDGQHSTCSCVRAGETESGRPNILPSPLVHTPGNSQGLQPGAWKGSHVTHRGDRDHSQHLPPPQVHLSSKLESGAKPALHPETGLSLLGYQLCERLVTQHTRRVEATQSSRVTSVSCGGWIPWRRCPKTVYSTQYVAVDVPEARNVTSCCEGYEQLGFYCVLPLNRSGKFTSRPGVCPAAGAGPGASASQCSIDTDCPGLNKCCPWLGGHRCVTPTLQDAAPENMLAWYNVTILVKMDFQDLLREDPRLLNHTRLLGSLVINALQPLNASVHHLHSASSDPSTTLSRLLLGLRQLLPVASISGMLDELVRRVYEVVSVQVQDVNECLYEELSTCLGAELCVNEEGWHRCAGVQGSSAGPPPQLRSHLEEDCPPVGDHVAHNVTSTGFRVSWSSSPAQNRTFHVQVSRGGVPLSSSWTRAQTVAVAGLEAGVLYEVKTSYQGCGANISAVLTVKTEAQLFRVTLRIVDRNLTVELQDPSSSEYQAFVSQLLQEVEKSLPPAVSDLRRRGKLWIHLVSLQAGSVVATLRLTVQDPEFPLQVSTLSPMLGPLWASTVFQIDRQGTQVQDWDECADSSENDCSPAARCINLEGSYSCQCRVARDVNPSRSGRACEGDMGSPTGAVPSAAAGVTAPLLGIGTAALNAENLTLASSPRHLQDTQTAGPPPSISTQQHEERWGSTGRGVAEAEPSTAPGLGSTAPSRAPSSVPSSHQGATADLLDTNGQFLGALTTKPPPEDPTGHVVWHTTLPMWETPLSPTQRKNEDPSLPGSPALPRTPTLASLRTPTCASVLIERVTVSNVTSSGFHLAWVASLALRPTFQLTLSPAPSSTVGLETQDTRVVLSGLQPGVLHLVELVAKACGKEGAPAHLKVRTEARKLGGQVRLANVSFSESLRNTSSREHREFLQLFLKAVRGSLPTELCQQLDTGGVRLEVTRITNGSVMVEFHVLIIADVDVGEVSAAFLAALQNMTVLEVVPSDTFLQDYDECAAGEDDCAPGTTCRNTLGSFSCDCEEELDFPIEYSGRSCEGDSPDSTVPAPSPGASSPAPSGPSPRLTLSSAVRVLCEMEKVVVAVQKQFLRQEAVPESSLYLGQPACNVSHSNSSHVLLVAGWGECGTLVQSNKTDTVVRTTLRSDLSPDGVIRHLRILSPIHCAFRNHLLTSSGYTPEWGVYTVIEDLHGAGSFVTEMQLFVGESPIPQNHSVSASDDVKIEVGLFTHKGNLKVVLTECWATPSSNAQDPVTFGFINNSCPVPNTYTRVIENGDSHKAQFKLRIFSFINTSLVYLHCQLRVCLEAPGASCKINCNDLRVLRSGETSAMHQTSWGPLVRSTGAPVGPAPGLGAGYVALIVAGVLAVLAGATALVVVRCQRMTGNYSIKLRSDNFSYREFSQ